VYLNQQATIRRKANNSKQWKLRQKGCVDQSKLQDFEDKTKGKVMNNQEIRAIPCFQLSFAVTLFSSFPISVSFLFSFFFVFFFFFLEGVGFPFFFFNFFFFFFFFLELKLFVTFLFYV
jgi:hypothetical protein